MTELQLSSAVLNYVTSHRGVTSTPLSLEQVADELDTLRMRYIGELDDAGTFKRPYLRYTQIIENLTVKKMSGSMKPYVEVPPIYVSEKTGLPAIAYIGGIDLLNPTPYRVISGAQRQNIKHDQFIGKAPTADYKDGRLDIINITPTKITLIAVFEDPSKLAQYGYDEDNTEYPVPLKVQDMLIGKTAESYIRTMFRVPPQPNIQADITTGGK